MLEMNPLPLNEKERRFLELLLSHVSATNTFRFAPLRKAGVPEQTEAVFQSGSEFLDSLVNRKLQILRDKGWITMDDGLYTVLHRP